MNLGLAVDHSAAAANQVPPGPPNAHLLPGFLVVAPAHVAQQFQPKVWPILKADCLARDLFAGPGSRLSALHLQVDLAVEDAGSLLDALAHCSTLQSLALGKLHVRPGPSRAGDVAR